MTITLTDADSIRLTTSSTSPVSVTAVWSDDEWATSNRTETSISAATTTEIVPAPASGATRAVRAISIYNSRTGAEQSVEPQRYDGTASVLTGATLTAGERLGYESATGWQVFDVASRVKAVGMRGAQGDAGPIGLRVVADEAALSALETALLQDGTLVHVGSYLRPATLNKASTATLEPGVVVATDTGVGRWEITAAPHARWRAQATWYLNPAGDVEASGASSGAAIPKEEWERRVGGEGLTDQTLFLRGGPYGGVGTETIWRWRDCTAGGERFGLTIIGEQTVVFSGTMSSVQAISEVTHSDGQFTCAEIPTSWTASNLVRRGLAQMTSGAADGYMFFIDADLGARRCRFSPLSGGYDPGVGDYVGAGYTADPANGDTFEVVTFTELSGYHVFDCASVVVGRVWINRGVEQHGCQIGGAPGSNNYFAKCVIEGPDVQHSPVFDSCLITALRGPWNGEPYTIAFGCHFVGATAIYAGHLRVDVCSFGDSAEVGRDGTTGRLDSEDYGGSLKFGAVFYGNSQVLVQSSSHADLSRNNFWGTGAPTNFVETRQGSSVHTSPSFPVVCAGATNVFKIGNFAKTFAQLPFHDLGNDSHATSSDLTATSAFEPSL